MEILNRTDKRELIKKAKKKTEFAKKLTPLQKEYIDDVVEAGKDYARIALMSCFDVSVQGALIECTDLKYKEIEKVVYRCGELMRECKDVLENMNTEERIMAVKSIENEVAEKIANMIFEGKERKDIVKSIKAEYKGTGLTTQEINIYWKKGMEGFEKFIAEKEGIKKVEPVEVKESKFTISNKVVKVISCDVAGEHGEYEINNGVISIKGTEDAFVNISAVQNWASDRREALLKEIDKLNNLEGEVIEVIKEFM